MEKDNTNQNSPENKKPEYGDSKYYSKLYDDLPKEVVELLMKEHPLMDDAKKSENIRLYGGAGQDFAPDVFGKSDAESSQGTDTNRFDPVKAKRENEETISLMSGASSKASFDDDDYIQIIKHKEPAPRNRKTISRQYDSGYAEEMTVSKTEPEREIKRSRGISDRSKKEDTPKRPRQKRTASDYEKMTKEDALNEFFSNNKNKYDDYEDDFLGRPNKYFLIAFVVLVCLTVFFAFKSVSLSGKLAKATAQSADFVKMESDYSQLKIDKIALDEEVSNLREKAQKYDELTAEQTEGTEGETNGQTAPAQGSPAGAGGSYSTYTVVSGDTFWGIAEKTYGNGIYFSRILEANGLTENSGLQIGQTLKIPK